MSDLVRVIAGCTHRAGLLPMYEQQLGAAGIPLCLEINPELSYPNGLRMLGEYVNQLRRWLDKYGDCQNIIFTDAWDVLFYGSAEDVARKVPAKNVLCGAERNCFPDTYLKGQFLGTTPWKFLNGGVLASKPDVLDDWLGMITRHVAYHPAIMDQQWLNHRVLDLSLPMVLDTHTSLFYCMYLESGEMKFKDGLPHNAVTGTEPNWVHFNGSTDATMFLWKQAMSTKRDLVPA